MAHQYAYLVYNLPVNFKCKHWNPVDFNRKSIRDILDNLEHAILFSRNEHLVRIKNNVEDFKERLEDEIGSGFIYETDGFLKVVILY